MRERSDKYAQMLNIAIKEKAHTSRPIICGEKTSFNIKNSPLNVFYGLSIKNRCANHGMFIKNSMTKAKKYNIIKSRKGLFMKKRFYLKFIISIVIIFLMLCSSVAFAGSFYLAEQDLTVSGAVNSTQAVNTEEGVTVSGDIVADEAADQEAVATPQTQEADTQAADTQQTQEADTQAADTQQTQEADTQAAEATPQAQETPVATFSESDIIPADFDTTMFEGTMTGVLMDADTGEVLFSKGAQQQIYPASTTKIMTGLLAIELNGGTLDGEFVVGAEVNQFSSASSLMGLKEHQTVSVKDAIYGLMLASGNDAAAALAVHLAGSEANFISLMNQKAQELGMTNTVFANPHGLCMQDQIHYSTAEDMAKLAEAAYGNELLMEIMGTTSYRVESTELDLNITPEQIVYNSNYLMGVPPKEELQKYTQFYYEPATGMKTGLVANVDGYSNYGCLVSSASKDGMNLIVAVFGDTSIEENKDISMQRWQATIDLFEYGFGRFVQIDLASYIEPYESQEQLRSFAANDPSLGRVTLSSGDINLLKDTLTVDKETAEGLENGSIQIETEVVYSDNMTPPIDFGEVMGEISYKLNDQVVASAPILSTNKVFAAGEEDLVREEYDLPIEAEAQSSFIALFIIPIAIVGVIFALRFINKYKRKKRIGKRFVGHAPFTNGSVHLHRIIKQEDNNINNK